MNREITSRAIWILWIVLQTCTLPFALDRVHDIAPIIEFPYQQTVVTETQRYVDIPVVRRTDLLSHASVSCTTESLSAKAGQDFEERTATDVNSTVTFLPGEASKFCRVSLIDDAVLESSESFAVTLSHAASNGSSIPTLGTNHTVTVTITDDEDFPTVQLEHGAYTVQGPLSSDRVATAKLVVLQFGDISRPVTVRVSTRDGLAVAGTDFHPKTELLTFEPGVSSRTFEVDILHNGNSTSFRTFRVDLALGGDSVSANLGLIRSASVTIVGASGIGSPIVPMAPIVVSLMHYDNVGAAGRFPSPGYPLVCVSPCDPKFPENLAPKHSCRNFAANSTHYMWEIASAPHVMFKPLLASTLFSRVDTMVLDSVFFREGLLVRCAVWPKHAEVMGIPVRSEAVTIGGDSICCTVAFPELPVRLQTQSFIATLKYVGSQDKDHANHLHIQVQVPHQDGMLPLISTHALHNANLVLTDPMYSKQHVCSSLNMGSSGFLNTLDQAQEFPLRDEFPQQFNSELRGAETVLLYRHLDLKKCVWSFDAWYHMGELVDLCGGYVLTDSQVKTLSKSSMTVRVPLYVSYVTAASLSGWTSVEHHTEMDFTFSYNPLLWQAGMELDRTLEAQLQILRLSLSSNGQLIVHFQTKAMFRGLFVTRHHSLPDEESRLVPPNNLVLKFALDLLWTAETFDGPTQTWRAISDYSLKDYTGKYILQLIPCTVFPMQSYTPNFISCTAHPPQKFVIPIAFQQTNRPVPVTYSLNTEFHLLNNENIFLSDPRYLEHPLLHADYDVVFSKGQKVYGRVLWHPSQDLASAYELLIDKVFLCAGLGNYIPAYDPSGEEYGEGPQFGCLQPAKKLKHRIIILDRSNNYEKDMLNGNFLDLHAVFVKDTTAYSRLQSRSGVDGFVFDVDGLYKIDAAQQWFVQVLYSIGLAENDKRFKRTILSRWPSRENGTNMKPLTLIDAQEPEPASKPLGMTVLVIVVISLALISSGLFLRYYLSQRRRRSTDQHPRNSKCSARPLLASTQRDTLAETAANQYCTVRFQTVPAMVNLSEETKDTTEV